MFIALVFYFLREFFLYVFFKCLQYLYTATRILNIKSTVVMANFAEYADEE